MKDVIVIGGGAAGFFAALTAKEANPKASVILIEKAAVLLSKVRVSGGGRCNVTHNCFDPKELSKNYPRGSKELIGPFHTFSPKDTIAWFKARGVEIKCESDGRMFPTTDSSQTIIDCLTGEANKLGVEVRTKVRIETIQKQDDSFSLTLQNGDTLACRNLILATGSSFKGHDWAKALGHTIERPIPSLFTFNSPASDLKELSGIAQSDVEVSLKGSKLKQRGPLLITHFGFSGPAIIKLSAWAAPFMFQNDYKATFVINWLPDFSLNQIQECLRKTSTTLAKFNPFQLTKSLWLAFLGNEAYKPITQISRKSLLKICERLHADTYQIEGKTTFKKEFVTCGGVKRSEVNFKTMESKMCRGLYFTGEVLDIDGVTGGFNFQNAWTTGFIAGNSVETNGSLSYNDGITNTLCEGLPVDN